ncbi:MAG: 50S ribosomal protein L2 [candidate division Zixibacteria bacterium]|nr:50S ribosomal protein L2 [candidate division Zixibacteria bacterium]
MGIKAFKPTSAGIRHRTVSTFEEITKSKPERRLISALRGSGGRNNKGRVTAFCRGGGHKRNYRLIDFKRDKRGVPARVAAIEYDPNRSARIALLFYADGDKRYILAPDGIKVGETLMAGQTVEVKPGNAMPLSVVPLGLSVHNVEMREGKGGQLARSAGSQVILTAREAGMAHLRLPSGEIRLVREGCYATIGQVGNLDHENLSLGKAGASRWLGRRPSVRGVAMNPVDHPMGGGEGRSSGGRHPCSPWGLKSKGLKTRKRKNQSNRYIIKKRDK